MWRKGSGYEDDTYEIRSQEKVSLTVRCGEYVDSIHVTDLQPAGAKSEVY
jgi:hypothetical protein